MSARTPIVVLISGRGSNLAAILECQRRGDLGGAEVMCVFSNKPGAPGLAHARRHGVPTEVLEHTAYPSRQAFDAALEERIERYQPALVVLAGFMRILSAAFTERFRGRLINTHPSLLPLFPGLDAVGQALAAGAVETGCTVHFVNEVVDGGPIISQRRVPVFPDDDRGALERRILSTEHQLLPETIAAFCSGARVGEGGA